jgi:Tol biopolymer transport system component
MNQNGTAQTRLTNQAGLDVTPAWSSDGAKLAFATNRHGTLNFELYTIDADGTNPTRLTNNPALDLLPDW